MSTICTVCPRQCGVLRQNTELSKGFCKMPLYPMVARAALHFGEEPCISGTNGSGTVFFSGCSLSCIFCQNHQISHKRFGKTITPQRLSEIFRELEQSGAHNINLVNPTHFAVAIREALSIYKPAIPIVYNSGGYERVETLQTLEGLIDVYLPDIKYISANVAQSLSSAANYFAFAAPALAEMIRQTGKPQFDEHGILQKGTVVRHLVLPGCTNESIAVLDWLAQFKEYILISVMFQYTPMGDLTAFPSLNRTLTKRECNKIWDHIERLEIENGYIQELEANGTEMIPLFDLTGV